MSSARAVPTVTVLYVEDEENDAFFMQRAFTSAGLDGALRVATDGRAAIDYLSGKAGFSERQQNPVPALVLLDLNLPAVPGFEVLRWIRQQPEYVSTPVVVFSSSPRPEDKARAHLLGANGYLEKPCSGTQFGKIVEDLRKRFLPQTLNATHL